MKKTPPGTLTIPSGHGVEDADADGAGGEGVSLDAGGATGIAIGVDPGSLVASFFGAALRATTTMQAPPSRSSFARMVRAVSVVACAALQLASALVLAGCRRDDRASENALLPSASAPVAIASPPPIASSAPPIAPAPPTPLQLLRFRFTSDVHGKEPVDELKSAPPGERVYAYFAVRNRTGDSRHLTVVFWVNGEARTTLALKVEPSWQWRTWAFNTLRATDDHGSLEVVATDDTGAVLVQEKLPIKKK